MPQTGQIPALKIGTRGSPLALVQARFVRDLLMTAHGLSETEIAIVPITTSGDRSQRSNRSLADIGGKGLFSKEIELALSGGEIDLAVHSAKDMATVLPTGLDMSVFLPREDIRDAFISLKAASLDNLAFGAIVGTSSLRRRAQLLRQRPDLKLIEFRGNLGTRLQKLADGQADATLLAAAGLKRLGEADKVTTFLDPEIFLPAPAQGAIGIEIRAGDDRTRGLIAPLDDKPTRLMVRAERAMLKVIDGSCRTPIGALSRIDADRLYLKAELISPDGRTSFQADIDGALADADRLGHALGEALLARAGARFIAALKAGQ